MLYLDHPLLSAEQERALSARIRAGVEAGKKLAKAKLQRGSILEARIACGLEARNELVQANVRWANQLAIRYAEWWHVRDADDLCQEAYLGLMDAAVRFKPLDHGTRFSTYATQWIFRHCHNWLRASHLVHVPNGVMDRIWAMEPGYRSPDPRVAAGQRALRRALPITTFSRGDSQHPADDYDEQARDREEERELAWSYLDWLKGHDRRALSILMRRFGLNGEAETLGQVGETEGITRERVRQIQDRALLKLRTRAKKFEMLREGKVLARFGVTANQ